MRILKVFLAAVLTAVSVRAQDAAPPAHISFVDGSAVVYHAFADSSPDARGTRPDSEPAVINMPIVQGDRIRTFAGGRVEVMFPDGASIAIDPESEVEFISATRVRVLSGIIEHHAAEPIDPRSPSAQNLPPDLQTYGSSFDQNGSWQNEPSYGNVWYPTAVAADWRPYYDGYWSSYPSVRVDVDRLRTMGMADASLRPLGIRAQPLVLDPWTLIRRGLGIVGNGTGLCQLVPARLRQPTGGRLVGRLSKFVERLDGDSTRSFRRARLFGAALRRRAAAHRGFDCVYRASHAAGACSPRQRQHR